MPIPPVADARKMVRQRTFRARSVSGITDLIVQLQAERFTGKITLNLSQGGWQDVLVEDSAALDRPQGPAPSPPPEYLANLAELR